MHVIQSSGTQTGYSLNDIRKMTFATGSLTVTRTDNSTGVYTLNSLQHLSFADYTTEIESIANHPGSIQVYPNPVGDVLNIELPGAGTVQLLSLEGKVIQSKQVTTVGIITLATGQLQTGIYVCRYSNGKEIKTVKIIKQ